MKRVRLDILVVDAGLAENRSRAQAMIMAGQILVDEMPITKAGTAVDPDATLRVRGQGGRFVSRGGDKLAGALDTFGLDPRGLLCLDIGASTGGFCDCLLQRGARAVVAVDVGYGQLHESLRSDPRVRLLERTNARHLDTIDIPERIDLVVVDVSFISLTRILPALARVADRAPWLVMVKPQFEVGREHVGKGGVVRDDGLRQQAADRVAQCATSLAHDETGRCDSQLAGPKGNVEIFLSLAPRLKPAGPHSEN